MNDVDLQEVVATGEQLPSDFDHESLVENPTRFIFDGERLSEGE